MTPRSEQLTFIVSSVHMLRELHRIMEFLSPEVRIKMVSHELIIDGFKGLYVESKADGELTIPKYKLQHLRRILELVSDQPITIKMGHCIDWIEIYHLTL